MRLEVPIFYLTAIIKKKQIESFNASTHSSMTHSYPFFFLCVKLGQPLRNSSSTFATVIKNKPNKKMTEIKKNHLLQRIRLMKQAAVIRQSNGMSRHDALVTAHRIGKLIRQMHHGNVCFRYTKQDGTIRRATGTLIGYEHSFRRPYTPKPENTFVVYYDIDAKGWRTFHAENFLDIEVE